MCYRWLCKASTRRPRDFDEPRPGEGVLYTPCDYAHLYCSRDLACLLIMTHSNNVTKTVVVIFKTLFVRPSEDLRCLRTSIDRLPNGKHAIWGFTVRRA